jgi:hypothetical protein
MRKFCLASIVLFCAAQAVAAPASPTYAVSAAPAAMAEHDRSFARCVLRPGGPLAVKICISTADQAFVTAIRLQNFSFPGPGPLILEGDLTIRDVIVSEARNFSRQLRDIDRADPVNPPLMPLNATGTDADEDHAYCETHGMGVASLGLYDVCRDFLARARVLGDRFGPRPSLVLPATPIAGPGGVGLTPEGGDDAYCLSQGIQPGTAIYIQCRYAAANKRKTPGP